MMMIINMMLCGDSGSNVVHVGVGDGFVVVDIDWYWCCLLLVGVGVGGCVVDWWWWWWYSKADIMSNDFDWEAAHVIAKSSERMTKKNKFPNGEAKTQTIQGPCSVCYV
jgi:hypothetical protein